MAEETDITLESRKLGLVGENSSSDNTVGKRRSPKIQDNAIPHYLRASTGSCHDACKYGKPHEFKNKPWKPMRRRVSAPPPDTLETEEIQIFVDKKVKVALQADKLEPPFTQESSFVDGIKKTMPPSRKSPAPNARPFRKSPSPEASKATKKVIRSSEKLSLPDTLKPVTKRELASAPKRDISTKRASSNAKERNAPSGHSKSKDLTMVSGGRRSNKATTVFDPKTSRVSIKKVSPPAAAVLSLQKIPKVEVKRTVSSSMAGPSRTNPGVKAGISNLSKNKSPKDQSRRSRASPKKEMVIKKVETKEPADEKAEEKTLHMIESPSPLSPESLNSSSRENSQSFTSHEVGDEQELASDYTDGEADDLVADSLKEARILASGDRDPSSMKLKFRRGKIIDPQPEISSPRRLRFRQGRNPGDNLERNGGPRRRSYRKRASNDSKEPETGQVKVVLKHQEIETKKDMQVLLNNVIEETASKLVEMRKSKVKALVGAFETVISLQESKQSPPRASNVAANR